MFHKTIDSKEIIKRGQKLGTLNDVFSQNSKLTTMQVLKSGTARLLADTEHTLMYEIQETNTIDYEN